MKFLHLINVRWYNATAWYAVNLARISRDKGHEAVIAGCPHTPPVTMAQGYGLPVYEDAFNTSNPFTLIAVVRRMRKWLKEEKPDVVVCHRSEFFWWFALEKRIKNAPWKLIRVRGDVRIPKSDPVNRFLHDSADGLVTSGEFMRQHYINLLRLKPEKICTIFGGVNTDTFRKNPEARTRIRKEFGYADGETVIGIVGRFDPIKGHDVLFTAVSKLVHEMNRTDIRLLIIGFTAVSTEESINDSLKRHGIESLSVITGRRDDLPDLLNALDVGVVSSLGSEAVCRVAMELMATGVPVVASDVGVLPEVVPAENIYPRDDASALAERLLNHVQELRVYSDDMFFEQFYRFAQTS